MFRRYNQTNATDSANAFCGNNFRDKFEKFQQHFFDGDASFATPQKHSKQGTVAANILEHSDYFEIQLFAAGRKKEFFKIALENNVLQVSYEGAAEENTATYMHREFQASSFKRAFQLNEKMLTEQIHASFEDGVLTVIIPKDPLAAKTVKDVKID